MNCTPARPGAALRSLALAACLAAAGCSTAPVDPDAPRVVHGKPLPPYELHEECMHLAVDDRVDYRFEATFPVKFNIHYHDGNAVLAPIVRDNTRGDSGVFVARIAHDYCLMWEAGPTGAFLDYRVWRRPAGASPDG